MAKKSKYTADPGDLQRSLTKTEVTEILDSRGRGFVKNTNKVMHFVERVLFTLEEATRRQHSLDATNMDLRAQIAAKTGYAGSMDPEMALRYVDPAVLAKHGDHAAQQMAEAAEVARRRFEGRAAAVRERLLAARESGEAAGSEQLINDLLQLLDS